MRGRFLEFDDLKITGRTAVYALIGDPVDHSLSPTIQNAAFRSIGLEAIYIPFRVEPFGLKAAVRGLRVLGVRGFNVTAPHKIKTIKYLDEVEAAAAEVGSVNTVTNLDGNLVGSNTDGTGALQALEEAGARVEGASVLLFGAGGAGRAIAHALAERNCAITLVNRTTSKAQRLAKRLHRKFGIAAKHYSLSTQNLRALVDSADLIVNASSMGMEGTDDLPVSRKWLREDHWVLDIVYKPLRTKLLQNAAIVGARTINGLDMLVNQGACSFSLWTKKKAPMLEMRRAIAQQLPAIEHASSS